jgi:ribosome biogenesis GTPase
MHKGTIIKSTGSWYHIKDDKGEIFQARIIGKFRLNGLKLTNPVAVGDRVQFIIEEENKALIKKIDPRENYVVRQSPRKKHFLHLLAANIDHAILIMTITQPNLKQGFIDRFLMMTEPYNIPVSIVFNKMDLHKEKENNMFRFLHDMYSRIGYNTYQLSAITGENFDVLKEDLKGKITLVCGQSGVGKSSIINQLLNNEIAMTDELSNSSGKGQHTTTFAEMYDLDNDTHIIDTPGMKSLSFNHYTPKDIVHNFKELFEFSLNCKFSDCTHRDEPKCAVKQAITDGEISELRYINYLQLIEETEDQNYWERLKDM